MLPSARCRHKLGSINGYCLTCKQPIKFEQLKFSGELDRMLTRKEQFENKLKEEVLIC